MIHETSNQLATRFVEALIKTFKELNHREPTDQEVNDMIERTNKSAMQN